MTGHRLREGGILVDREAPLTFTFNGKTYQGFAGDSLASALLANGVRVVARSFKYHRPRGIYAIGAEEPNALVRLADADHAEPNLKATQVPLFDGLVANSVNCWPSPKFDLRSINQLFSAVLPAGFYYKTFMWPKWSFFEGAIRRAAGLGVAPVGPDPDKYSHMHARCDVLVVGAGAAGIDAALAAANAGNTVIIADDGLATQPLAKSNASASYTALDAHPRITFLRQTTVFGYYDHNALGAIEIVHGCGPRQRLWKIRAAKVILATGAIERPIVFANNDRPGVMSASAIADYAKQFGVLCGRRIVIFTNNSSVYAGAIALKSSGATVTIIDTRPDVAGPTVAAAEAEGIVIRRGQMVSCALGRGSVTGAAVIANDGTAAGTIACDVIGVSGGWAPVAHLFSQSGGSLRYDQTLQTFVPAKTVQAVEVVGSAAGNFEPALDIVATWRVPGRGKAFVDYNNDVTAEDVDLAARENYVSVEHLKRYTTLGMGVDQGKTSNVNGLALLGAATNRIPEQVGTTKFRPPYSPVTIGAIAGPYVHEMFHPLKYMATHDWHVQRGAAFDDYGGWVRPTAYPLAGENWEVAAIREVKAVRNGVGLFDASPLGKIEVVGPDAASFLDRIYVGNASSLKIGRARYGLMLNENGIIVDDGVFVRIADDHFLVHTTSGGADGIAASFEEWLQCEWRELDVVILPVTNCWGTLTISGPRAAELLTAIGTDIDLNDFSHMAWRLGQVGGFAARVLRASFSGEASYEISVPSRQTNLLAERIWQAGLPLGLVPYGVEALMTMRIEKGYIHVGVDTDGTTLPGDLGMDSAVGKKASDFIGRRSLTRADALRSNRLQLVGLSSQKKLAVGAHVLGGPSVPCAIDGYITSSAFSPSLERPIALGLVRRGRARLGDIISVYDMGSIIQATIVEPVFLDKEGARLRG